MEDYHYLDNIYREDTGPPDPDHGTAGLYDDTPDLYIEIGGYSETVYAIELWFVVKYLGMTGLVDYDAIRFI